MVQVKRVMQAVPVLLQAVQPILVMQVLLVVQKPVPPGVVPAAGPER
ncbi:hypothetical protein ACIPWI_25660 [Streptomyces sp. NPDC090046]